MKDIIKNRINDLRKKRGWSLDTLAQKINEDKSKIHRLEQGKQELTINFTIKLVEIFQCTLIDLIPDAIALIDNSSQSSHQVITLDRNLLKEITKIADQVIRKKDKDISHHTKAHYIAGLYELAHKNLQRGTKSVDYFLAEWFFNNLNEYVE